MTPIQRSAAIAKVRALLAHGMTLGDACLHAGCKIPFYRLWSPRFDDAGIDGLCDLPRTGRPPSVVPTAEDKTALRRAFLRSNLKDGAGSMTLAARYCAKTGQLSEACAAAILKPRASKHILPVEIRRAVRASGAEVARYRDPKAGTNDGIFMPGWLRLASDGSRRLLPNERWCGDDASVNVGVVVPWQFGGDKCADRFGCRVARFQLLSLIDCATDLCVGWNYVMRFNDAYTAADVVSTLHKVMTLRGGAPAEIVMEGGSWQAERTTGFLEASGIHMISAKGRPNQKLIESWFNRLWTVLSMTLPPTGQIGRFRGEMKKENELWMRCRKGAEDPRLHFPKLTEFLRALDKAVGYVNNDVKESRTYGNSVPAEAYSAVKQSIEARGEDLNGLHPLPQGLRRFSLPVRTDRVLRSGGCAFVRHVDPFGYPHTYQFQVRDGAFFDGAPVCVSFDPDNVGDGAVVELAQNWHDMRAGRIFDESAQCLSRAPMLTRTNNFWAVQTLDPRAAGREAKRASRALVGQQVAAFDERGIVARHAEQALPDGGTAREYGFGQGAAVIPEAPAYDNDVDFAALELAAGVS